MPKACLIVVHGLPATGKTAVSTEVSKHLFIPIYAKDSIKEAMFDTIGFSDKAWSTKVSHASHRIMDLIIGQELGCGRSLMIEGNFKPNIDSDRFRKLCETYSANCLQILCWAEGEGLYTRFQQRETSPDRHPAHVHPDYPRSLVKELLAPGKAVPLTCADKTIEVNTSDFSHIDYTKLINDISLFINGNHATNVASEREVIEDLS